MATNFYNIVMEYFNEQNSDCHGCNWERIILRNDNYSELLTTKQQWVPTKPFVIDVVTFLTSTVKVHSQTIVVSSLCTKSEMHTDTN